VHLLKHLDRLWALVGVCPGVRCWEGHGMEIRYAAESYFAMLQCCENETCGARDSAEDEGRS